jgi:hypothetical protein
MDPFNNMSGGSLPMFDKKGKALTSEERTEIAKRQGLCMGCGVKTHKIKYFIRHPVTDDDVYEGICIHCEPDQIPKSILSAWELRNKPATPTVRGAHFKPAVKKVQSTLRVASKSSARNQQQQQDLSSSTGSSRTAQNQTSQQAIHETSSSQSFRTTALPSGSGSGSGSDELAGRGSSFGSFFGNANNSQVPPRSPKSPRHSARATLNQYLPNGGNNQSGIGGGGGGGGTNKNKQKEYATAQRPQSLTLPLQHEAPMESDTSESSRWSAGSARSRNFRSSTGSNHSPRINNGTKDPRPVSFRNPPILPPETSPLVGKRKAVRRTTTIVAGTDDYTGGGGGGGSDKSTSELLMEMQNCHDDPSSLRQMLHRLRNSLQEYPSGAVNQIEPLLGQYCLEPRLLALVSGTIWRISASGDDQKQETTDSGVIGELVDVLRKNPNDRDLGEWVIGTLASLAYCNGSKKVIAEVGGIEAIIDFLRRHDKWLGNFEWSCRCLYNTIVQYGDCEGKKANGSDEEILRNMALIEEANGVAAIVNALEKNPTASTAQRWAMKLLWRLQSGSNDSTSARILRKMAEAGFVPVANKVLWGNGTTGGLFQLTAELTCAILGNFENDQETLDCAIDCIPSVAQRMKESIEDEAIQEAGCRLLSRLCSDDGRVIMALKEADAFATVVLALEAHSSNTNVAESACWALWKMSARTSLLDAPLVKKARKAMDAHELSDNDQNIVMSISGFTANTCHIPQLKASDFPIACIVRAIELPFEDPMPYETAERALSNLYAAFPETSSKLAEVIKIPRMIEIIEDSSATIRAPIFMWLARIASKSNSARDLLASGILEASVVVLRDSVDLPLVEDSENVVLLLNLLDLISTVLASEDKRPIRLPSDIAQSIITLLTTDQPRAESFLVKSFSTLRNLLLVSESPLEVNGLVECLTNVIESAENSTAICIEACNVLWALTAKYPNQNVMALSSMFHAVVGLMGERDGETPYHPGLQAAAAGAAASISLCLRHEPIIVDSEHVDLLIANVYRALEFDHEGVETMASLLGALLNLCYLDEGKVIRSGVIVVVIDLMYEIENHESVQEKGCTILQRLASSENLQVNLSIAQTDGIDLLIMTLATYSTNELIQAQVCKALSHLSIDPESRMVITTLGGLQLLVNALEVHTDNLALAESVSLALLNLSSDGDVEILIESGVVETVVEAMKKYPTNSSLQQNGMGVLQNVSMKGSHAKAVIAATEGIDAVIAALSGFLTEPSILERAFTTLWSLAVLDSNQVRIAEANGIILVINGMLASIDHEQGQRQGCGCLCTLASDPSNKVQIRASGGVDAIIFGMRAHYNSEPLQVEACRALSSLAVNMVATQNEINAILSAMRSFPVSADLQEHACYALRNFLLSPDKTLMLSHESEVTAAVCNAMTACPDSCCALADEVLAMLG